MDRVQSRGPQSGQTVPPDTVRPGVVFVGYDPEEGERVRARPIAYDVERRTFTYLVKPLRQSLRK